MSCVLFIALFYFSETIDSYRSQVQLQKRQMPIVIGTILNAKGSNLMADPAAARAQGSADVGLLEGALAHGCASGVTVLVGDDRRGFACILLFLISNWSCQAG